MGNTVIYRELKKPQVVWPLEGWRPREGVAHVLDDEGCCRMLECILPPHLDKNDPSYAFPPAPPTEISEVRLVPPPCRESAREADSLREWHEQNERHWPYYRTIEPWWVRIREKTRSFPGADWERIRLLYDKEVLS